MSQPDLDLLRQFTRDRSQDAFTELVKRHVNLVHSAALRQVCSPQLAEEVAQSVFADLARVAATTSSPQPLTPWLYAVTRRTAIDVIRKESRRQLREQIAVEMNNMNATAKDWSQIEPLLDDAMATLNETDRSAILLRFFENKSLREVGDAFGASEDAAQKRVSRAVERLREFFSIRNVTIGASGLAVLISANAVQAAPAGLAITLTAAALGGTAVSTSTIIATTKTIAMTALQKSIIGTVFVAAVGTGIFAAHQASQLRGQIQTLQQQQVPLVEQIRQLQQERDDATNRLAGVAEEVAKNQKDNLELLKLRGEVGVLRNQLVEKNVQTNLTMPRPVEPVQSAAHQPGTFISLDQLVFAGYSTPEAAFESVNWAIYHGSYEQVIDSFAPGGARFVEKDKFEADQAQASEDFKGIQIMASKSLSDKMVELKVKQFSNPKAAKNSQEPEVYLVEPMLKINDQWKWTGMIQPVLPGWETSGQVQIYAQ